MPRTEPERALSALYGFNNRDRPWVTYAFLGLCFLVTISSLIEPKLYRVLGGIEPRQYWWQPFTAAFEHGWPGFPSAVHLALNAFLILECGRPCERLLGSGRFLLLGILTLAASGWVLSFTEGANGSSMVIWSWGPPLFVALMWAKRTGEGVTTSAAYGRLRTVLILMYGVIVVVMGLVPYLAGWRGNPLVALVRANLFHLVATGVGIGFAWSFASYIRERLIRFGGIDEVQVRAD